MYLALHLYILQHNYADSLIARNIFVTVYKTYNTIYIYHTKNNDSMTELNMIVTRYQIMFVLGVKVHNTILQT